MSNGISFSMQNPGANPPPGDPVLYSGIDNTLNFVFINTLGITRVEPHDTFTIIIPDTLIKSANASQLDSADWAVSSVIQPDSGNPNFTFVLTPSKIIAFTGDLKIGFIQLQGLTDGTDNVSTSYTISNNAIAGTSEQLFIQDPPSQPNNLEDVITFNAIVNEGQAPVIPDTVFISPASLSQSITNTIHISLTYSGSSLVAEWDPQTVPKITILFSYGNNGDDLTNALKAGDPDYNPLTSAWKFETGIAASEKSLWKILPLNTSGNNPSWIIEPTSSNKNLFTGEDSILDIFFTHVITILPAGSANLYIKWKNIPDYNQGIKSIGLDKANPTAGLVGNLNSDKTQLTLQGPNDVGNLQLSWNMTGVQTVTLSFSFKNNQNPTISNQTLSYLDIQPVLQQGAYALQVTGIVISDIFVVTATALDSNGNRLNGVESIINIQVTVQEPFISSLEGSIEYVESGAPKALITWVTTPTGIDAPSCYLSTDLTSQLPAAFPDPGLPVTNALINFGVSLTATNSAGSFTKALTPFWSIETILPIFDANGTPTGIVLSPTGTAYVGVTNATSYAQNAVVYTVSPTADPTNPWTPLKPNLINNGYFDVVDLKMSRDGGTLYVLFQRGGQTNVFDCAVQAFDAISFTPFGSPVPVAEGAISIAVDEVTEDLYIACTPVQNEIDVINTAKVATMGLDFVGTFFPQASGYMEVHPFKRELWVANLGGVQIYDITAGPLIEPSIIRTSAGSHIGGLGQIKLSADGELFIAVSFANESGINVYSTTDFSPQGFGMRTPTVNGLAIGSNSPDIYLCVTDGGDDGVDTGLATVKTVHFGGPGLV